MVRFIDGPLDGVLLDIPADVYTWHVAELDEPTCEAPYAGMPQVYVPIITHVYYRLFENAAYFMYQGIRGEA